MDTNGAGDTFATAYMLALASRSGRPGTVANWAAAQAVSQPQARSICLQQLQVSCRVHDLRRVAAQSLARGELPASLNCGSDRQRL